MPVQHFLNTRVVRHQLRGITGSAITFYNREINVTDLPYGVQHFTTEKTRNPLEVIRACAPGWVECLRPGGVMVLAFNHYQPKRPQLQRVFEEQGLEAQPFSAPHRMSEAILRDVLVMQKPG